MVTVTLILSLGRTLVLDGRKVVITIFNRSLKGEYIEMRTEWSDAWAVTSDPGRFAAKFNSVVPGAFRSVTADDVRQMAHCGLIGRRGYYERADLETIRGILWYERFRERAGRTAESACGGSIVPGELHQAPDLEWADTAEGCLESCGV